MHSKTTGRSPDRSADLQSLTRTVGDLTERIDQLERLLAQRAAFPSARTKMDLVLAAVADCYRMQVSDLTGRARTADVSLARQIAMVLCMDVRPSLTHVCDIIQRDRGTVLYALRAINDRRETDQRFAAEFEAVKAHVAKALADWQAAATKEAA